MIWCTRRVHPTKADRTRIRIRDEVGAGSRATVGRVQSGVTEARERLDGCYEPLGGCDSAQTSA